MFNTRSSISDTTVSITGSTGFSITPATSATTVISQKLEETLIKDDNKQQSSKRKHEHDANVPFSASKKNRSYLPAESKPIYFELKKHFRKLAQWKAHQRFLLNCASSGLPPRSLFWNPLPPWAFNRTESNTQWAATTLAAQSDLCKILASDCGLKAEAHTNSITALSNDLKGLIPPNDHTEILHELEMTCQIQVDKLHAEKILSRTKATNKSVSNKNPTPTTKRARRNSAPPPNKRTRRFTNGNTSKNNQTPKNNPKNKPSFNNGRNKNGPNNQPQITKNELTKHLAALTRALNLNNKR